MMCTDKLFIRNTAMKFSHKKDRPLNIDCGLLRCSQMDEIYDHAWPTQKEEQMT